MVAVPPQQWPVEQGDETARLLGWLGTDGGSEATLEGALLMTLRFVAGLHSSPASCTPPRAAALTRRLGRGLCFGRAAW